ncbi:MAG: hypothetical protein K2X60_08290 [Xanthobacteraceae bacterium]|nr:hypothetical protein [Xanthobacteraceae bacterium]
MAALSQNPEQLSTGQDKPLRIGSNSLRGCKTGPPPSMPQVALISTRTNEDCYGEESQEGEEGEENSQEEEGRQEEEIALRWLGRMHSVRAFY